MSNISDQYIDALRRYSADQNIDLSAAKVTKTKQRKPATFNIENQPYWIPSCDNTTDAEFNDLRSKLPPLPDSYMEPKHLKELVRMLLVKHVRGVRLSGPKGSGKTVTAAAIGHMLTDMKRKVVLFKLPSGGQIDESHLIGERDLVAKNGVAVTEIIERGVIQAARYSAANPDTVVLVFMDEWNLSKPEFLVPLNNLADDSDQGIMSLKGDIVVPTPGMLKLVLCENLGYQGTRAQNEAVLDRCPTFPVEGMNPEFEMKLLEKDTGCDSQMAEKSVEMATRLRAALDPSNDGGGEKIDADWTLSYRSLRRFVIGVLSGTSVERSFYLNIACQCVSPKDEMARSVWPTMMGIAKSVFATELRTANVEKALSSF
jgi:MoxR-like ATPase